MFCTTEHDILSFKYKMNTDDTNNSVICINPLLLTILLVIFQFCLGVSAFILILENINTNTDTNYISNECKNILTVHITGFSFDVLGPFLAMILMMYFLIRNRITTKIKKILLTYKDAMLALKCSLFLECFYFIFVLITYNLTNSLCFQNENETEKEVQVKNFIKIHFVIACMFIGFLVIATVYKIFKRVQKCIEDAHTLIDIKKKNSSDSKPALVDIEI